MIFLNYYHLFTIFLAIFRSTSLRAQNLLQQQALDTSRPRRQCWSQPAPRIRQKHPRQPCKTRLATAKDWHPTLMNGTSEVRRKKRKEKVWTTRMRINPGVNLKKKDLKNTILCLFTHTHTHSRDTHKWDCEKKISKK